MRSGAYWAPQLAIPGMGCAYQCTHCNQACRKRRALKAHTGDTAGASSSGDQKAVCFLLYLAIKKKKTCHLQQYVWIEGIMLDEINQTKTNTTLSLICGNLKEMKQNEQRLIDTENK